MMNATTASAVMHEDLTKKPIDVNHLTVAYQHKKQ